MIKLALLALSSNATNMALVTKFTGGTEAHVSSILYTDGLPCGQCQQQVYVTTDMPCWANITKLIFRLKIYMQLCKPSTNLRYTTASTSSTPQNYIGTHQLN